MTALGSLPLGVGLPAVALSEVAGRADRPKIAGIVAAAVDERHVVDVALRGMCAWQ